MFTRLTRLPLRRCLHTASTAGRTVNSLGSSAKLAIGASAVTATYMTWRVTREGNQIALDSPQTPISAPVIQKSVKLPPKQSPIPAVVPSEVSSVTPVIPDNDSTSSTPSEDVFLPDVEEEKTIASDDDQESEDDASASAGGASGGAFNPVTGEINWDCPCLGGMAHGPCGPEFREAFSCFVFSEDEPKGINCVDKFQAMQTCFRAHPEVYADEIMNDDDDDEPAATESSNVPPPANPDEHIISDTSPEIVTEIKPHLDETQVASDP